MTFEVRASFGFLEEEKARIETSKTFDDFVVNIESLNQLILRDEREVSFSVYKKSSTQDLYGKTLNLPLPASTDFYDLLDKFNTSKPRAAEVTPLKQIESSIPSTPPVMEKEEISSSPVHEVSSEPLKDNQQLLAVKEEIEALKAQLKTQNSIPIAQNVENENAPKVEQLLTSRESDSETISENNVETLPQEDTRDEEKEMLGNRCSFCGQSLSGEAKFCSACGRSVDDTQSEPIIEQTEFETLDELVEEEHYPMDMSQLFSFKDGWNVRPKIEKEVALEFEMKKEERLQKVEQLIERAKQSELDARRKSFEEQAASIEADYKQKLAQEKTQALIQLDDEAKTEVEKRVDVRRQYLTRWYKQGLEQLNGKLTKQAEVRSE